jgi:hypothetical protein
MPNYKVLGIFSFANNLLNIKINDSVILKKEKYNVKSKNAIGVYSTENKKIGYLPIEEKDEVLFFQTSYKISKIILNQDYPSVEISRDYDSKNIITNVEFNYIKKIKYDFKIVDNLSKILLADIERLTKYLQTRKIKLKRVAVLYIDDNYINLALETIKGIEIFYTVTSTYFNNFKDKFDELLEYNLIDNTFFKDLMFYRLECYYEANYKNINEINLLVNKIKMSKIEIEPLDIIIENIDIILLTKLYINYLITQESEYILKYLNKFSKKVYTDVEKILKKIIPNYSVIKNFYEINNIILGNFFYDHSYKIYSYIDFCNSDTIFIISDKVEMFHLINCYLSDKNKIIYYNPESGIQTIIILENYNFMNMINLIK